MAANKHNYDESKIKTLSSIGAHPAPNGDILVASVTGAIMMTAPTFSSRRSSTMPLMNTSWDSVRGSPYKHRRQSKESRVRDFGRGIPLGKIVDCVSTINTGAKYNDEVFQFSVGLNGVGTKAVNALSNPSPSNPIGMEPMRPLHFPKAPCWRKKKGKCQEKPMALSSTLNPTEAFSRNCSYARIDRKTPSSTTAISTPA